MKREFITDSEKGNNLHLDCRRYGLQVKVMIFIFLMLAMFQLKFMNMRTKFIFLK